MPEPAMSRRRSPVHAVRPSVPLAEGEGEIQAVPGGDKRSGEGDDEENIFEDAKNGKGTSPNTMTPSGNSVQTVGGGGGN